MVDIKNWALDFFLDEERVSKDDYFGWGELNIESTKKYVEKVYSSSDWNKLCKDYGVPVGTVEKDDWAGFIKYRNNKDRKKRAKQLRGAIDTLIKTK